MTAKQIKNELDQTERRLSELTDMRTGINNSLKKLHDDFIAKKTPLEAVQAEQSRLDALDNSIRTLETRKEGLESSFENQTAIENRTALLQTLVTIGNQCGPSLNEYFQIRKELDGVLGEYIEKMVGKIAEYRSKQREYRQTLKQLGETSNNELEKFGLSEEAREVATKDFFSFPQIVYGEPIAAAENIYADKINRQQRAEMVNNALAAR